MSATTDTPSATAAHGASPVAAHAASETDAHRARPTRDTRTATGHRIAIGRNGRASRLVAIVLAVAVLAAGCGSDDTSSAEPDTAAPSTPVTEPADDRVDEVVDDEPEPEPDVTDDADDANDAPGDADDAPAQVARTTDHLDVLDSPGSDEVIKTLAPTTSFGSPTTLLVHEVDGDWLEVLLPTRPNGTTGWVHADDVEVSEVELSLNVDLEARELTVFEAGEEVLTTEVAIGDADHPTPTGSFFITDKLDTGDADGAYGPYALGLSAWSDVLTEFAGGDGQVGIHGTNVPASIGEAASHGCIRVDNAVIEQLAHLLPLGTPVTVS